MPPRSLPWRESFAGSPCHFPADCSSSLIGERAPAKSCRLTAAPPAVKKILPFLHYIGRHLMATHTASTFDNLPAAGYVRQAQLIPTPVPFSSATLWRKCKSGDFPKPVKLSERVTAWRVEDVRQWLAAQAAKGVAA